MRRLVKFLIAGCGPCGLGAALEIEESETGASYLVVDPRQRAGGWASSQQTPEGFTFDYGGHVLFPHKYYPRFVELLDGLALEWVASVPKRGVSLEGRFLPYPAQRNLQRLGPVKLVTAITSLLVRRLRGVDTQIVGDDLQSYLLKQFGQYLTETLMSPLNSKMWAHHTSSLSNGWVTLRSGSKQRNVPDVSLRQTIRNVLTQQDSPGWTSDTFVTYPAQGGSGAIWERIASKIPSAKLLLGVGVQSISLDGPVKVAKLSNGDEVEFEQMISSIPLDTLLCSIEDRPDLHAQAKRFVRARSRLYGFGIEGEIAARYDGLHSFHVPDADVPFWRVSLPSNVSAGTVPSDGRPYFSVLCEISEPASQPAQEPAALRHKVECSLRKLGLVSEEHTVVSRFEQTIEHGYPVPFLGRDALLHEVQSVLEPKGIYSRGRFGAWKYEISNQDHAFMQGVEVVRRLLFGVPEQTYTNPCLVNEEEEEEQVLADSLTASEAAGNAGHDRRSEKLQTVQA